MWTDGALFLNPAANEVLADTGPFPVDGLLHVTIVIYANTGVECILEQRDAANLATLKNQILPVTLSFLQPFSVVIHVLQNERLRLLSRAAVVGEVEASFFWRIAGYG